MNTAQDLRFALRSLRRAPGFTTTALLTLALGIGLTAAMLGVVYTVLLAPLPYVEPERLVGLDFNFRGETASTSQVGTAADFIMQYSRSFERYGVAGGSGGVNLATTAAGRGHAFPVQQLHISHDFLLTLGIHPVLGRNFTAEEDTHDGPRAALLSDAAWRTRFGADPAVVGRVVRIDEEDVPVVGVLPADAAADLRGGSRDLEPAAVFQPLQLSPRDAGYEGNNYEMIARLRPGVSLGQARGELATLLPRFAQENSWYKGWHAPNGELNQLRAFPLSAALAGDVRGSLLALLGAAAAVLLVACLNLAGLTVARTAARTPELAVRSALGASRATLLRLLLSESAVLAAAGAAVGLLVARIAAHAFVAYAPIEMPHLNAAASVGWLAVYAAVLSGLGTLLFGLLPAAVVLRSEVNQGLRNAGSQGQSVAYQRTGRMLIVGQVALAFALLTAASLLLRTFVTLRSTAPGVETAGITIGQVTLKGDAYKNTAHSVQFSQRVVEQLQHTPGVLRAGAVNGLPLDHGLNISGWPADRKELRRNMEARFVDPGYLATIGIGLLQGRGITEGDTTTSPRVAIINASMAKRWWPNGDAIGSRINIGAETEYTVVGIARDTHEHSLLEAPRNLAYIPLTQVTDKFTGMINNWFPTTFVVRASTGVNMAAAMQAAVSSADAEVPVARLSTMQEVVDRTVAAPRFFSWLSSSFAAFTLLLAAVGLFGLLSYQVTQRTREIGVRMALGATRQDVLGSFLRRALVLTVLGLGGGLLLSTLLPRLLGSAVPDFTLSLQTTHTLMPQAEAATAAALLLLVAATSASMLPAMRAASIEPVQALRAE